MALREYSPAGVVAERSIVGIGRSALASSIRESIVSHLLEEPIPCEGIFSVADLTSS